MKDRDVPARRAGVRERDRLAAHVLVNRQREDVGLVAEPAQQIADGARAVADRIAAMCRRHPLVNPHGVLPTSGLGAPTSAAVGRAL